MPVGDCEDATGCVAAPASAGDWMERAFGTAPAGLSAISFTSLVVSASLSAAPRDWIKIVAGPWKCRNSYQTISPLFELVMLSSVAYSVPPKSPPSPRPDCERTIPHKLPRRSLSHRSPESCIRQPSRHARDLKAETT